MEIQVEAMSLKGISILRFKRGRNDIKLRGVPVYNSASIPHRETLFEHPNNLIAALPKEQQDALWDVYQEAHDLMDNVGEMSALHSALSGVVVRLYELIPYEMCRSYIYRNSDIQFPSALKTEFTEDDIRGRNYVDRTYLKDDYIDLVVLALGLRFMVPIWGEYVAMVSNLTANEYKEKMGMELLSKSAIDQWPPMRRFTEYVEASLMNNGGKGSISQLLKGLSSIEVPKHLKALAAVRKLSVSPLNYKTESDSLIKILYNFVTGTNNRLDNLMSGNIGDKRPTRETSNGEDDNSSVWDMYKLNEDVPAGDKEIIEVFTENVPLMAARAYAEVDQSKVSKCVAVTRKLEDMLVSRHQITLTQWILGKVISPKGIEELSILSLLRCMAAAQAILWDWGFHELALLITAAKVEQDDAEMFIGGEGRSKIAKSTVEVLHQLYPFWQQSTRKLDLAKRNNCAVDATDLICEDLNKYEWSPNAPKALLDQFDNLAITKRWVVSGNIKSQMAELIIRLNQN